MQQGPVSVPGLANNSEFVNPGIREMLGLSCELVTVETDSLTGFLLQTLVFLSDSALWLHLNQLSDTV